MSAKIKVSSRDEPATLAETTNALLNAGVEVKWTTGEPLPSMMVGKRRVGKPNVLDRQASINMMRAAEGHMSDRIEGVALDKRRDRGTGEWLWAWEFEPRKRFDERLTHALEAAARFDHEGNEDLALLAADSFWQLARQARLAGSRWDKGTKRSFYWMDERLEEQARTRWWELGADPERFPTSPPLGCRRQD